MWKITAEYTDLTGSQSKVRCVIECPEGHPYDVMKQTVKQFDSKRCKMCKKIYQFPDTSRKKSEDRSTLIEVNDCFDMSYVEIAAKLNISAADAKQSCDSAIGKLLEAVTSDPNLVEAFRDYLESF